MNLVLPRLLVVVAAGIAPVFAACSPSEASEGEGDGRSEGEGAGDDGASCFESAVYALTFAETSNVCGPPLGERLLLRRFDGFDDVRYFGLFDSRVDQPNVREGDGEELSQMEAVVATETDDECSFRFDASDSLSFKMSATIHQASCSGTFTFVRFNDEECDYEFTCAKQGDFDGFDDDEACIVDANNVEFLFRNQDECNGGHCLQERQRGAPAYCTRTCFSNDDCPSSMHCGSYGGDDVCLHTVTCDEIGEFGARCFGNWYDECVDGAVETTPCDGFDECTEFGEPHCEPR